MSNKVKSKRHKFELKN